MLGETPQVLDDAAQWAGAFIALAGALAIVARGLKRAVVQVVHPQLHEIKSSISQLSSDNTAQHVQNANAALARDQMLGDRIDGLAGELRSAGERFETRIVVLEETVGDHIANKSVHAR